MAILNEQRVIAIEEHYYDDEVTAQFEGLDARTGGFVRDQLRVDIESIEAAGYELIELTGMDASSFTEAISGPMQRITVSIRKPLFANAWIACCPEAQRA